VEPVNGHAATAVTTSISTEADTATDTASGQPRLHPGEREPALHDTAIEQLCCSCHQRMHQYCSKQITLTFLSINEESPSGSHGPCAGSTMRACSQTTA